MFGQTSLPSEIVTDLYSPIELMFAEEWGVDALDRLRMGDIKGAKTSLAAANFNILKLPPGTSYESLEGFLYQVGVKLTYTLDHNTPT